MVPLCLRLLTPGAYTIAPGLLLVFLVGPQKEYMNLEGMSQFRKPFASAKLLGSCWCLFLRVVHVISGIHIICLSFCCPEFVGKLLCCRRWTSQIFSKPVALFGPKATCLTRHFVTRIQPAGIALGANAQPYIGGAPKLNLSLGYCRSWTSAWFLIVFIFWYKSLELFAVVVWDLLQFTNPWLLNYSRLNKRSVWPNNSVRKDGEKIVLEKKSKRKII